MAGVGTATIDFGAFPGSNEASVVVPGQTGIVAGSHVEAWFMADTTADHSANDHSYAARFVSLTCGAIVNGTSFTIYARSEHDMQGTFQVHWVWT